MSGYYHFDHEITWPRLLGYIIIKYDKPLHYCQDACKLLKLKTLIHMMRDLLSSHNIDMSFHQYFFRKTNCGDVAVVYCYRKLLCGTVLFPRWDILLVRQHLHIEMSPRFLYSVPCSLNNLYNGSYICPPRGFTHPQVLEFHTRVLNYTPILVILWLYWCTTLCIIHWPCEYWQRHLISMDTSCMGDSREK